MLRTISTCEKNVYCDPPNVITIPAATSTKVIDEMQVSGNGNTDEIAFRTIQNVGGSPLNYCFGDDCDGGTNYHGVLSADTTQFGGGQLEGYGCGKLTVWSAAGTKVAITVFRRSGL